MTRVDHRRRAAKKSTAPTTRARRSRRSARPFLTRAAGELQRVKASADQAQAQENPAPADRAALALLSAVLGALVSVLEGWGTSSAAQLSAALLAACLPTGREPSGPALPGLALSAVARVREQLAALESGARPSADAMLQIMSALDTITAEVRRGAGVSPSPAPLGSVLGRLAALGLGSRPYGVDRLDGAPLADVLASAFPGESDPISAVLWDLQASAALLGSALCSEDSPPTADTIGRTVHALEARITVARVLYERIAFQRGT